MRSAETPYVNQEGNEVTMPHESTHNGNANITAPHPKLGMGMPVHIYQALVEQSAEGIAIAGMDTLIIYANPAFQEMTGFGEQTVGTSFFALYSPETQAQIQTQLLPQLLTSGRWQGQLPAIRPGGEQWITYISVFVIANPIDGSTQIAAILRDVSEQQAHDHRLRMFEALVEHAAVGMMLTDLQGNYTYANTALRALSGYGDALLTMNIPQMLAPDQRSALDAQMATLFASGRLSTESVFQCADGSARPVQISALVIRDARGAPIATAAVIRDLTEDRRAEQEHRALQERIIAAQQATLQELSTPLIPIVDGVVVMPLIGTIDSSRAQQVIETLLSGIATNRVTTAILDITGVPVVDTQVATVLVRAAQAAKLLGAQVTLTGIRPEVAQLLIGLGVELSGLTTRNTLQSGVREALRIA